MTTTTLAVPDINTVFDALELWIKQRPRLQYADYGNMSSYSAEVRQIAKDKERAMKALHEARSLQPPKVDILMDSFRAFSGRLQWVAEPAYDGCPCDGGICQRCKIRHLEYCTGQYWPTEYRKAAASVLETYIAAWKQQCASEHPQEFAFRTIADVKAANARIGNHWFDRSTMRFFNTKIESGLIGGRYFITSERYDDTRPRRYSVRLAKTDGSIDTVGEFQQYRDRADARDAIKQLLRAS